MSDDITLRQASHVVMARFVKEYTTPNKITVQIFVNLVRSHQPEVRFIVRQARDILMPALPIRSPPTQAEIDSNQASFWVRWTRRVMIDEGHTSTQLVSILQMILGHPDLYRNSRDYFIPYIVSNLGKIGLLTTTRDQKALTIDLAELCLEWEKEDTVSAMQVDTPEPTGETGEAPSKPHEPAPKRARLNEDVGEKAQSPSSSVTRDGIISFLARFLLTLNDAHLRKELGPRAISLLGKYLTTFPHASIKLAAFDKIQALGMHIVFLYFFRSDRSKCPGNMLFIGDTSLDHYLERSSVGYRQHWRDSNHYRKVGG
jgi:transformation/transcription domain-associated protein